MPIANHDLRHLPIPACKISLPTGEFQEFNDAFGELFHLDRRSARLFDIIFSDHASFEQWLAILSATHGATAQAERTYVDSHGTHLFVHETARIINPNDTRQIAEIFHCNITVYVNKRIRAEEQVRVARNILDSPDINLAVYEMTTRLDGTQEISWVNQRMRHSFRETRLPEATTRST
jgi:hypothetical protein